MFSAGSSAEWELWIRSMTRGCAPLAWTTGCRQYRLASLYWPRPVLCGLAFWGSEEDDIIESSWARENRRIFTLEGGVESVLTTWVVRSSVFITLISFGSISWVPLQYGI